MVDRSLFNSYLCLVVCRQGVASDSGCLFSLRVCPAPGALDIICSSVVSNAKFSVCLQPQLVFAWRWPSLQGGTSSRHGCASRGTLGSLPSASSREQKNNICNTARERITSNSEAFVSTFQKKKKKYRLLLPYVFSIFYRLCILHTHSQLFPFMNNMPCASPLGFRYSTLPCMFI